MKTLEVENINFKIKDCVLRKTLNFTDIIKNNNKFYNLEVVQSDKDEWFIYTIYGRVGQVGAEDYRACETREQAEAEAEKILKGKAKKGYVEVKLAKADVGSEQGQAKIENKVSIEALEKAGIKLETEEEETSKLHTEVRDLIRTWFGITQEFIELNLDTKKCPLGQLSLDQIDLAKKILEEARLILHGKKIDKQELNRLTSSYYSNIPHVLGSKIDANVLRFDTDDKVDKALDILDVFADAKNVQNVISKKSAVDAQYATLNATLEFVNPDDPVWKWIDAMLHKTRAGNHTYLGKLKAHRIFRINRNEEEKLWLATAERIAKDDCKFQPSDVYAQLVKERPDLPKDIISLYKSANILPGWHGTRRANMIGITTKGLLIRPSGVVHAGSMYGDGIYWATNSTKSINYTDADGSYWAGGKAKIAYLFLADVVFGKQQVVSYSSMYTKNSIKPNHSVWAKAGSAVYNDELITYTPSGKDQQHRIKYIIEFETQAK